MSPSSLLLLQSALAEPCAAPASSVALLDATRHAREGFDALDSAGFEAAVAQVEGLVPCLLAPLDPAQAAEVHMVMALSAFVRQDEPATIGALQAAAAADPDADPADWLPGRHPLLIERKYALLLDEGQARELKISGGSAVWVDGASTDRLIPTRPALIQQGGSDGGLSSTLWWPETPLPEGLSFREPRISPRVARRLGLGSGVVLAAGAATGLGLWSVSLRDDFRDPDTPYEDLTGLEQANRAAALGAAGSAVLAAGLGVALVMRW